MHLKQKYRSSRRSEAGKISTNWQSRIAADKKSRTFNFRVSSVSTIYSKIRWRFEDMYSDRSESFRIWDESHSHPDSNRAERMIRDVDPISEQSDCSRLGDLSQRDGPTRDYIDWENPFNIDRSTDLSSVHKVAEQTTGFIFYQTFDRLRAALPPQQKLNFRIHTSNFDRRLPKSPWQASTNFVSICDSILNCLNSNIHPSGCPTKHQQTNTTCTNSDERSMLRISLLTTIDKAQILQMTPAWPSLLHKTNMTHKTAFHQFSHHR